MPETYADWKSLKPLTAPVPVGTKCVVVKLVEGDKLAIGEIVTTIDFQRVPNCKNSDGIVDFFGIDRLAILPTDYQAEPKAKQKPERKIVHGFCCTDGYLHAICNDGSMWYLGHGSDGQWHKLPPIPQD